MHAVACRRAGRYLLLPGTQTFKRLLLCLLLTACWTQADGQTSVIRIVPLGDSITQGVGNDYPEYKGYDTYRRRLYRLLINAGYQVDFVGSMSKMVNCGAPAHEDFDPDHEGHFAWRTDHIINGVSRGCRGAGKLSDWLKTYTPDIALVHLGTNDIFQRQSVDSTLNELRKIIRILRSDNNGVAVFLARILPVNDKDSNERIVRLNTRMDEVAADMDQPGSRVIIVDQYSGFDPVADLFDGVHPNLQGEEKMAQRWFEAIDAYLKAR